ncbi:MAG: transcriptional regulator [Bacteroidetes bacterium GWA2_32_17]|nr:MAG: transcriptional regulator [Bacteroidetes bacterium GWA2_32_17]
MKIRDTNTRKLIFDRSGLIAFSVQLKKLRHEAGVSQSQLAYEAGISLSQIARIETVRINPTLSTVFAIARALDIPLTTIFNFSLSDEKKTEKYF